MSLTDIRASYRDAFQTLRNVAREAPAHRNGVAAGTSQTKPSEAPSGVVVELSSKAAKGEEKGDVQSASDNARIEALSQKKGRARAKLQELMKQLKIDHSWSNAAYRQSPRPDVFVSAPRRSQSPVCRRDGRDKLRHTAHNNRNHTPWASSLPGQPGW